MLEVSHLRVVYGSGNDAVEAIGDLSLTVGGGELVCVVGPSGCGKSTLLRCLSGLMSPTSGEATLGGERITGPPERMALVFQQYGRSLFPWMSVRANVEIPLRAKSLSASDRESLVEETVAAVGLADALDRYPWQLSGGMQQRVAIARALAYQPEVLMMDEPFASVDAQTRAELEDLLLRIWAEFGVTVLFVTHDVDESVYLGDRVAVLSKSPSTVSEEVVVDLPRPRDQLTTKADPLFSELRTRVLRSIRQDHPRSGAPLIER